MAYGRRCLSAVILILAAGMAAAQAQRAAAPPPSQFLGFEVGGDRQLADYRQIVSYFRALATISPRVQIEDLGPTTMGNDLIIAVISSPENLKNKQRYQEIARKLADPRGLSKEQIDALVHEGKAIVLVTCNIHATEIGASQMAMEWAYTLATAQDEETRRRLDNVILLLMPSINPDGQIMVTEWYRKYVGTRYEGGAMPYLYHHYVGHDNNRDWYMLTQKETRAINHAAYGEWFPDIWLDEHQMGDSGPRIFVPPYAEPYSPSINPLIFRGVNLIGTTMAFRLEEQHKSGVIHSYSFDAYWPGGTRNTGWWKNVFGLLTETASARIATPVDIPVTELSGGSKGLVEYGPQVSFPNPWPGGRWRLRDVMDYERIISDALLERASVNREDFERGVATMAQEAVAAGKPGEYWVIPAEQHDAVAAAKLAHLMREHGLEVMVARNGDFLVPTAQPYGKFATEMLGLQRYPKTKLVAGSSFIPPYDMTAWSLPLLMGVEAEKRTVADDARKFLRPISDQDWPKGGATAKAPLYALAPGQNNNALLLNAEVKERGSAQVALEKFTAGGVEYAPGTVLLDDPLSVEAAQKFHLALAPLAQKPAVRTARLKDVRVGLYKPSLPGGNIDEGWTRWVLEQYGFAPKSLDAKVAKGGKLNEQFDAIIIPAMARSQIVDGAGGRREQGGPRYVADLPPDYAGGMGREGVAALREFVQKGGTLITFAQAGDLISEEFNLPVRNALAQARSEEFLAPGALLRIQVDPNHPVGYGMTPEAAAFVLEPVAFQTSLPMVDVRRSVIAWYPKDAEDILMSGWIRGADRLERKAAVVAFEAGKGKVVMFSFSPQHRGQTDGTYKLLFNAIRWAGME